jgi:acetyltransferase-like isoleucine patch superfamily enzyme
MNNLGKKIYWIKMLVINVCSNIFMRIKFFLFQIPYPKGTDFFGQTHLYKQNNSSIKLGKGLTFRSYPNSNLIGIDRNCSLSTLTPKAEIIIGDDCGFSGTVIGAFVKVELGKNVRCGANTLITDSDWHLDDPRAGEPRPVIIEDNVWLGVNSTVLKGVRIGENSVIGAGSVVVKDIPKNVIAAGNPCKVIKSII